MSYKPDTYSSSYPEKKHNEQDLGHVSLLWNVYVIDHLKQKMLQIRPRD